MWFASNGCIGAQRWDWTWQHGKWEQCQGHDAWIRFKFSVRCHCQPESHTRHSSHSAPVSHHCIWNRKGERRQPRLLRSRSRLNGSAVARYRRWNTENKAADSFNKQRARKIPPVLVSFKLLFKKLQTGYESIWEGYLIRPSLNKTD